LSIVIRVAGRGRVPWELPASRFRRNLDVVKGGRRTMYELAAAIAVTGREVELRGAIVESAFEEICDAAGARPALDPSPRLPTPEDTIIVPEGWPDPLFAPYAMAGSRCIMMLLAPPGFAGWPFTEGPWEKPDPLTVDPDSLGTPEQFQAVADLGFGLWTHSRGLQRAAQDAGCECQWIGSGQPEPFPELGEKDHDVVVLERNRWEPLATGAARESGGSVLRLPASDHAEILRGLGRARILPWPSRVEGHSRVQLEARAMGTVPVALSSNRFAEGLGDEGGAVIVDSVDEIGPAARALLGNLSELERLAAVASESARRQVEWDAYVGRVDAALSALPPVRPGARARHHIAGELARGEYRLLQAAEAANGSEIDDDEAPGQAHRGRADRGRRGRAGRLSPFARRLRRGRGPTVYVVGAYKPRGGGYVAYHLARLVAERFGHRCRVVSLRGEDGSHGLWTYPEHYEAVSVAEMESAISAEDLLIANPSFSQNELGLRVPGRKLMYVQGFGRPVLDGFFDRYVCASDFLRELMGKLYEIDAPVIPPFIELDEIPAGPPWEERPPRRILVLAKTAGERLLARFHDAMRTQHPSVAYSLRMLDEVPRAELFEQMSRHRFLLTLSPREGFGLPPLEAMAAGCTVAGFHGGGGTHYMRPGENSHVVAYPAMEALCAGMASLLTDDAAAQRLAAAGRETAVAYGRDVFERRWAGVLREILDVPADSLR
jgi:glycosyltransferase involved in cell wall biosynthesis